MTSARSSNEVRGPEPMLTAACFGPIVSVTADGIGVGRSRRDIATASWGITNDER